LHSIVLDHRTAECDTKIHHAYAAPLKAAVRRPRGAARCHPSGIGKSGQSAAASAAMSGSGPIAAGLSRCDQPELRRRGVAVIDGRGLQVAFPARIGIAAPNFAAARRSRRAAHFTRLQGAGVALAEHVAAGGRPRPDPRGSCRSVAVLGPLIPWPRDAFATELRHEFSRGIVHDIQADRRSID
jgi:hypothetical protein